MVKKTSRFVLTHSNEQRFEQEMTLVCLGWNTLLFIFYNCLSSTPLSTLQTLTCTDTKAKHVKTKKKIFKKNNKMSKLEKHCLF